MQIMAKRKQPTDKPARVRVGYNLNVWIDEDLGAAFEKALAEIEPRTSKTALLEMLLRDHLRSKGFWPAKGGQDAQARDDSAKPGQKGGGK